MAARQKVSLRMLPAPHNLSRLSGKPKNNLVQFGVLIYKAYASKGSRASELSVEALEETLKVNLYGALVTAQLVIPSMLSRRKGTILFTGGGLALSLHPDQAALSIGKASLRTLVDTLGKGLYHQGIQLLP